MRVAVVSTHPIQYQVPWFRELALQNLELKVYYAVLPDQQRQGIGFGESFAWDIPLLEGYEWELLPNTKQSPSTSGFLQSSTPAIYSKLAKYNPAVVIVTGWQSLPLLQAVWAAYRLRIPCIVRGESNGLRPRSFRTRAFHRLLFSRFDAFLSIGKLNRQFYLDYGIPEDRIISAPYFIENQRFVSQFHQHVRERDSLRRTWNIDDRQVCFLFAGKLEPKKRVIDLVKAIESAIRHDRNVHLLVVGNGELMNGARNYVEQAGLPVTFAGFLNQTEITRAYAAADCLVLPSDCGETWGLVVNEAMACGLPAIVSDQVGCGPDLVEEGVTGGTFACGGVEALAAKIRQFAADPSRLREMGLEAGRRVNTDYSVEKTVAGTLQAIDLVTANKLLAAGSRKNAIPNSVGLQRSSTEAELRTTESFKILHVIPSLNPADGGPSFAMPLIAGGLQRAGLSIDVAATAGTDELQALQLNNGIQTTNDGVDYFYFPRQTEFYKVSLPLSRWLSQNIRKYDLIHIHALFSYSSYRSASLARKHGVPYVIRPLGVLNQWGMRNRRRLLKRLSLGLIEHRILRDAGAVHFTSEQEKLEAELSGVTGHSAVIPLGFDDSKFRDLPSPEEFFSRFPLAKDRQLILFLSRLDPKKGLDLLLRAFASITKASERSSERSKTLLVIAGDGDSKFVDELEKLAQELGIADDVLWTGFLEGDNKLSALSAASIFVLPSYSENFGIALVEAMAAGLPSVMSDQVGIAADIKECDAGLVVPCDPAPLAEALKQLLDNEEMRAHLASNAQRLVSERFSLEAMTASLIELYDQVLARRSPDHRLAHTEDRVPIPQSNVAKAE
jgi:glycosyltransferase involved in cell wall biosynthesis